jgi:hypothetical protein
MNKFHILFLSLIVIFTLVLGFIYFIPKKTVPTEPIWAVRSIDTVKYSRDLAREKKSDQNFDETIDIQVKNIAETGANFVAISTPYDPEFIPYLKRWVKAARENRLNIWYRGNFAGWEEWFGYPSINRDQHLKLTEEFILGNPDLFETGDIFTSCPECENGGPGDPRSNGDIEGHRTFLIKEYEISESAFKKINKSVEVGYLSMNYDVASLIMDPETTRRLGGIVSIDHYIKDPIQIAKDAERMAKKSQGRVVIGEVGAPVPDIHGSMSGDQQKEWIEKVLQELSRVQSVVGVNYWVNVGGTTEIWTMENDPKKAVEVVRKYYNLRRN